VVTTVEEGARRWRSGTVIDMKSATSLRVAALLILAAGCHRREPAETPGSPAGKTLQPQAPAQMFGGHWLAMSREQKELYVSTFIEARVNGQHDLCDAEQRKVGDYMDAHKLHHLFYPADCESLIARYSHFEHGGSLRDASEYVKVLDDFYGHSECRVIPYGMLLDHLDDDEFVDGDTLFRKVRGGKINFGFFSGWDGIEDCLPI
jgi:hypothetical protein